MSPLTRPALLFSLVLAASCSTPAGAPRASADAETTAPPSDHEDARASAVGRIFAAALAGGRSHQLLCELCRVAPLRLSGSAGAERAVAWAAEAMRTAGLENVRLEPCTVPRWERGEIADLVVVAPHANAEPRLAVTALGGSVPTPADGIEGPLVRVTSFEELRALGDAARGAIVLFDRPMDPSLADPFAAYGGAVDQRSRGASEAAKAGAVAALVRSMTLALDDRPHTGALRYEEGVARIPAAAVSTLAAERLAALVTGRYRVRVRLKLDCRTLDDVPSANVVGEVVGRERPEEIVLIGAHLDAWDVGEGAHDDGAGCAQTLEAARLLLELGLRPRRTLRVCFFMNEENGLAGGRAYRDAHRDELGRHVLALESDRGAFTPRGFGTDAPPALLSRWREHARLLEPWGAGTLVPGGGGADISVLREHGVVLAEFLPDAARYFDVHHASSDTLDAVHPRELALGAAAIAAFAWCVADEP